MKNWKITAALLGALVSVVVWYQGEATAFASPDDTMKKGIFADEIDLSGMTGEEAEQAIEDYVEELRDVKITLLAADDNQVETTAGELGITWANPGLVQEALQIGTTGNVIERYKIMKDLEHENQIYEVDFEFNATAIRDILVKECAKFDRDAVNMSLKREKGAFQVVEGVTGYKLDTEASADMVYDYLTTEWTGEACEIALSIATEKPKGSEEELLMVQDVLGTFTTSFTTSGASRTANVVNGCKLVSDITLYPGEEFAMLERVTPFTKENGYFMAGSYLNGKVVDSYGGGICQVSTTLYNAVLLSELEVTERYNHSMTVNYSELSADAAIAESAGKDFRFVNNTDSPIYIEGIIKDKHITFNIYGVETRDEGRKVTYVSEILQTIIPPADMIYQDATQPIGYVLEGGSAHIGYKARLWKVVTENGAEVSREVVNTSNYRMTPRSATVGVATADPVALNEMQAAIGTGSIDHVKNVIALLTGQAIAQPDNGEVIDSEQPIE